MRISDWSSDVCSSDLKHEQRGNRHEEGCRQHLCQAVGAHRVHAQRKDATPVERVIGEGHAADQVAPYPQSHQHGNPPGADGPEEQGRSEEHTSELQSLMRISYAVFCLKKKKHTTKDK